MKLDRSRPLALRANLDATVLTESINRSRAMTKWDIFIRDFSKNTVNLNPLHQPDLWFEPFDFDLIVCPSL